MTFNKIIPFPTNNPNITGISVFDDSILLPIIHSDSVSTLVKLTQDSIEYIEFEKLVFSKTPISIFDNKIFIYGKDRLQFKGLKLSILNDSFHLDKTVAIETDGFFNFPTWSLRINEYIYCSYLWENIGGSVRHIGLAKLDQTGTLIWNKRFNTDEELSYPWAMSASENGIILSSGTHHFDQHGSYPQILNIDFDGNLIWRYEEDDPLLFGGTPAYISVLSDSSIVQIFQVDRWHDSYHVINNLSLVPHKIIKLDDTGIKIQEKIILIPENIHSYVLNVKKGLGDYFFAVGQTSIGGNDAYGSVTKLSNDLDTIWSRNYRLDSSSIQGRNFLLNDLIELPNGELLILGRLSNFPVGTNIWLLKTNNLGCISASDCGSIIDNISDVREKNIPKIVIFPNPTSGYIHIKNASQLKINSVNVFSINGRLKDTFNSNNLHQIDISHLSNGTYIMELILGKTIRREIIFKL